MTGSHRKFIFTSYGSRETTKEDREEARPHPLHVCRGLDDEHAENGPRSELATVRGGT
jgi:hypothetical protein